MARLVNQIITQSRAQGFKETGQQIDELSKKQTRLANQSTNTGREFAAQASGLGGLVAAYAGAAATIFALQQSFSALSAAARSEALVEGLNGLAQSLGQNGPKITASLKNITQGQLSIAESAQNASIALSAGLGADQIEQLADIATRASKVLGRDLTDSLQRLVRGVGKLEPELLDELGIFTRIDPAVERYAAKLGRATNSLTNFERRQAFANAVIEEGTTKYQNVDITLASSSQNLNKLAASLTDLATKIGQTLVNLFDPLISFLNKDISNLAGVLLLLGTLIFSKLGQVSKSALDQTSQRISDFAATTSSKLASTSKSAEAFAKSLGAAQEVAQKTNIKSFVGTRESSQEIRDIVKTVRGGEVAPSQIPGFISKLESQRKAEEIRGSESAKARAAELGTLIGALKNVEESASKSATGIGRFINTIGTVFSTTIGFASKFLSVISGFAIFFAVADILSTIISAITGIDNILNKILVGLASKFSELFDNLTKSKQANNAFIASFTQGSDEVKKAASSLEQYNEALKLSRDVFSRITANPPKISSKIAAGVVSELPTILLPGDNNQAVQDTLATTIKAAEDQIKNSQDNLRALRASAQRSTRPNPRNTEAINAAQAELANAKKALEEAKRAKTREDSAIKLIENRATIENRFATERNALFNKYDKAQNAAERERYLLTVELLNKTEAEYLKFYDIITKNGATFSGKLVTTLQTATTKISSELGIGLIEAFNLSKQGLIGIDEAGNLIFKTFDSAGEAIEGATLTLVNLLRNGLTPTATASLTSAINIEKLNSVLGSATVNADQLEGFISNLNNTLTKFTKIANEEEPFVQTLREYIQTFEEVRDKIKNAEKAQRDLNEVFGSSIQLAGKLVSTGNISLGGKVALTAEEQKTNQLLTLKNFIDVNKLRNDEKTILESISKINNKLSLDYATQNANLAKVRKEIEVAANVNKAWLGETIQFIKTINDINIAEEKRTRELQAQLAIQTLQNRVSIQQAQNSLENQRDQLSLASQRLRVELTLIKGDTSVKRLELQKASLEIDVAKIARAKELLEVQQQIKDSQAEANKITIAGRTQQQVLPIERRLGFVNQFEGLGTEGIRQQLDFKKQILELESALAQTVVDYNNSAQKNLEAAQKDVDSANKKILAAKKEEEIIKKRAELDAAKINAEFELQRSELNNRVNALVRESNLADSQTSLSVKQIETQRDLSIAELAITRARYDQLRIQGEQFEKHIVGLARVLREDVLLAEGKAKGLLNQNAQDNATKGAEEYANSLKKSVAIAKELPNTINTASSLITKNADEQIRGIQQVAGLNETIRKEARQAAGQELIERKALKDASLGAASAEAAVAKAKAADAVNAAESEKTLAQRRVDDRRLQLEGERDRLLQQKQRQEAELRLLKEIASLSANQSAQIAFDFVKNIRDNVGKALEDLGQAILDGTLTLKNFATGARDLFVKILRDLGTSIFQRLVVTPIQDFLVNALSKPILEFFGIKIDSPIQENTQALRDSTAALRAGSPAPGTTGATGVTSTDGSQTLGSMPSTEATKQATTATQGFGDRLKELGVNFQTVGTVAATTFAATLAATRDWRKAFLYTVVSTFATMISQIASKQLFGGAAGGFASAGGGIFGSIGNWVSGLFSSSTPTGVMPSASGPLYSAIGGPVRQMASGGYVGLRDRVPALLEPGEFVIRRPAAMAIGPKNLQQMNATGQTSPTNVMVNVNNQGTSQEVVGTPKVSINGRDMIVDIVVKDIQNNGPIRKTLRGM